VVAEESLVAEEKRGAKAGRRQLPKAAPLRPSAKTELAPSLSHSGDKNY
jgi:hypothetical protein